VVVGNFSSMVSVFCSAVAGVKVNRNSTPVVPATIVGNNVRSERTETAPAGPTMVRGVPVTVATLLPFVNVNSTDDAPVAVAPPITTVTVLALAKLHVAAVPDAGAEPTLAVHA
jgi:hypothetical protein